MEHSPFRFRRDAFEVTRLEDLDDREDVAYWRSRPAEERFQALEFLRQQFYDVDPATARISGFFEIVNLRTSRCHSHVE